MVLCAIFQSDHRADLALVSRPTLISQSHQDFMLPLAVAAYLHRPTRPSGLQLIDVASH